MVDLGKEINVTMVRAHASRGGDSRVDESDEARFGRRVTPCVNGCWAFNDDLARYGTFYMKGLGVRAHRFAYETMVGKVPDGYDLHHECENPGCVNPAHLLPLTRADHQARHGRPVVDPSRRFSAEIS